MLKKGNNIKDYQFIKNPNLILKEILEERNEDLLITNNMIEVYYPKNIKNELYLILPKTKNFIIDVIRILDYKSIASLKWHKNLILSVRHFFHSKNNFDYLLSIDENLKICVWDLTNNFKLKFIIEINYSQNISDALIIIEDNNINEYILTSTYGINNDNYSKLYSFNNNGKFDKNIELTNLNKTNYLIKWYNIKDNNDLYIIELCYKKIYIYKFDDFNVNFTLKQILHESNNCNGCLIKKNNTDYLWTTSYNGYINIFDLDNKQYISNIYNGYNRYCYSSFIKWNENYLIIAINHNIKIIDINTKKIINIININNNNDIFSKKILHPYYGESLLTIESNSAIKLWVLIDHCKLI